DFFAERFNFDIVPELFLDVAMAAGAAQDPNPFLSPAGPDAQIVPAPNGFVALASDQSKAENIVGDSREHLALPVGRPLITIENDIDVAALQVLRQHVPFLADQFATQPELSGQV